MGVDIFLAVATWVLAAATIWLALRTQTMAKAASEQSKATNELLRATLEEQRRTVLFQEIQALSVGLTHAEREHLVRTTDPKGGIVMRMKQLGIVVERTPAPNAPPGAQPAAPLSR